MNLSQFKQSTLSTDIKVDTRQVIHFVPDFDLDIIDFLSKVKINKNNLQGVVVKNINFKNKKITTSKYITDIRDNEEKIKVKMLLTMPVIADNKYVIYDHTLIMYRFNELRERANNKQIAEMLVKYLEDEYNKIKESDVRQNVFFVLKDKFGLYNIVERFKYFTNNKFFDKFSYGIIFPTGETIPLIGFDIKNELDFYKVNFSRLDGYLEKSFEILSKEPLKKATEEIIRSPEKDKEDANSDLTKLSIDEYDNIKLKEIIQKHNIRDPYTSQIIQKSVDEYKKKYKNVKNDDLEQVIFKAINLSLFGTDKIDEKYLNNPDLLFIKLEEKSNFYVTLDYPKLKNNSIVEPRKVIKLDKVSGPFRIEYEYNENIHDAVKRLCKTLEGKRNPVKLMKMKHEIKDNNLDRYIEYTLTFKNLQGGVEEPYELKLRIPHLLNGRYFKFNSREYIQASQQFLIPITKNRETECRFLTHYGMTTVSIEKMKYGISEIHKLIKYAHNRYPELITDYTEKSGIYSYVKFHDGVELYPLEKQCYVNGDKKGQELNKKIYINDKSIGLMKNEFLFNELTKSVQKINPKEMLTSGKTQLPYLLMHTVGAKFPYIVYFWHQEGLLNALIRFGIQFEIKSEGNEGWHQFILKDGKVLNIKTNNRREELIVNGLYRKEVEKQLKSLSSKDLNDRNSVFPFITTKYSHKKNDDIDTLSDKAIDPTTEEFLKFYDMPTNLTDVLSGPLLDTLLNDQMKHLSDLGQKRVRQAEYMTHLLYNELNMAHNRYSTQLEYGKQDARIFLDENYIIRNLLGKHEHSENAGSIVDWVNPFSPVDEIMKSCKVTQGGRGGIPSKNAFRKEQRTLHPSAMGNIAAHSTTEYGDVGIVNHHTMGVALSNTYGSYGNRELLQDTDDNLGNIGFDEFLIPFCNQMDSGRLVIARTHRAQVIPIKNAEPPIVATGAEYIAGQLASTKFTIKAPEECSVIEVKDHDYVVVEYKDGRKQSFDISPRHSTTKRNTPILLTLDSVKEGDKLSKGEMLAWDKMFNGDMLQQGRNSTLALLNYIGISYEDGYVISEKMSTEFETEILMKIPVMVPHNTTVIRFLSDNGNQTERGDILIEFEYKKNVDDYLKDFNLDEFLTAESSKGEPDLSIDIEDIFEQSSKGIRTVSPGGELIDVKIKINNVDRVDPLIVKRWKENVAVIKKRQKVIGQYNNKESFLDNTDTSVLRTSNHKFKNNEFEGALIEFYIKKTKKLTGGDKICNRYGAKGVVTGIIPEDKQPYGEYSKKIDIFLAPAGLLGRKNTAILKEMYIGKIVQHLPALVIQRAEVSGEADAVKLLKQVYELIDATKEKTLLSSVNEKIDSYKNLKMFIFDLKNDKIKLNYIVPPFNIVNLENIQKAAKLLELPLDERVYIPEINPGTGKPFGWTDPVPVGVNYYSAMEQLAGDYESTRGVGKYVTSTGQPSKGKSNQGGQGFGNLDVFAMLTYEATNTMRELMTVRSDAVKGKVQMIKQLRETGKFKLEDVPEENSTTDKLKDMLFKSIGLKVS